MTGAKAGVVDALVLGVRVDRDDAGREWMELVVGASLVCRWPLTPQQAETMRDGGRVAADQVAAVVLADQLAPYRCRRCDSVGRPVGLLCPGCGLPPAGC